MNSECSRAKTPLIEKRSIDKSSNFLKVFKKALEEKLSK